MAARIKRNLFVLFASFVGFMGMVCVGLVAQPVAAQPLASPAGGGTPPAIINFNPATDVVVGNSFVYQLELTGDPVLTYTLTNEPLNMSVNGSGEISWSPDASQTGTHADIMITVENTSGSDSETFSLQVSMAPEIISAAPTHFAVVGEEYTHTVEAIGDPAPGFSIDAPIPSGMLIGFGTGIITWTPASLGDEEITVRAANGVNPDDTQTFTIPVYSNPVISTTAVLTGTVGQPYQYDVDATGLPAPTYSLIGNPPGMTIDSGTGIINWIPGSGQSGNNAVQVRATNAAGTNDQSFTIDVAQGPQVTSVPSNATITAGQSFNGTATASGNPAPTFSLLNNVSDWLSIDPNSGAISGNSTQADAGINEITIQAENAVGSDTDSFTITVESTAICVLPDTVSSWSFENNIEGERETPDLLWSNNATCPYGSICPRDETGLVGKAADFNVTQLDRLSVSSPSQLDWDNGDSFSIQLWVNTTQDCTGNKVFAGKPRDGDASQGDWWLGCGASGVPTFSLRDGAGGELRISGLTPINDGQWHHIVALREAAAFENRLYVDGVLAASGVRNYVSTFANDEPLEIGWFAHLSNYFYDGMIDEMAIHNTALTLTEIQQAYQYGSSGAVTCAETAVAPQITSTAIVEGAANSPYTYDVNATGIPAPTYTLVVSPTGMTISATTGLISWTPTVGQVGLHPVEVQVNNSGGSDNQTFNIDVSLNAPPIITSVAPLSVTHGSPYTYQLVADFGDPPITFSFTNTTYTPPTGMSMNGSGLISWTPTSGQIGLHTIEVQADNDYGMDTQQFTVQVNDGPNITSSPVAEAIVGTQYSYDVEATGSPAPQFSFEGPVPAGMTIHLMTGLIEWDVPSSYPEGPVSITVKATNVAGSGTQTFDILVKKHYIYLPILIK